MAEYIEREAVINLLHYHADEACSAVVADFEEIPTADVQPVVHCRECKHNPGLQVRAKGMVWCRKWRSDVHPNGFCYCGAKMDLEE